MILQRLQKKLTETETLLINSDKTKRLIAMDTQRYREMIHTSLHEADKEVRFVQPTSTQQKINKILDDIARHYAGSSLQTRLEQCKCSEPLPNVPYVLPKDHKPGTMRGRPIISSIDSGTRGIQRFLSGLLQPLVERHVQAHLKSTLDFIDRLKRLTWVKIGRAHV